MERRFLKAISLVNYATFGPKGEVSLSTPAFSKVQTQPPTGAKPNVSCLPVSFSVSYWLKLPEGWG